MRNAFAAELTALAEQDQRIVMLSGDIGNQLFDKFKKAAGNRFLNCGVAEANLIGMAAGLAMSGMRPVAYTIAPFITYRCYEQIRIDVCYHQAPVVIVGVGAGLSYASLGATHHSCEDIAVMRALPNMQVIAPADAVETKLALRAALASNSPTYIRLGKKGEPKIHQEEPQFKIGKGLELRSGKKVSILATGTILPVVLEAADLLLQQGIDAQVVSCHTIKPRDEALLTRVFRDFPLVCTIEEHSTIGGFGSDVAEWAADQPDRQRARLLRFGTGDEFIHEASEQDHARKHFGLSPDAIAARIAAVIKD